MKIVTIAVLSILATTAYAGGKSHPRPKDCPPKAGTASVPPSVSAGAGATADQWQQGYVTGTQTQQGTVTGTTGASTATVGNVAGGTGGAGGQGGKAEALALGGPQTVTTDASNQGTSKSTVDSHDSSVTTYQASRIPVNTAVAGMQETTAACWHAEGLGVQTMGAGSSVGFTFKDKDCVRASLAQGFYSRGQFAAGDKLECAIKVVRDALGEGCLETLALTHADDQGRTYHAPDAVTHQELNEAVSRAFDRSVRK